VLMQDDARDPLRARVLDRATRMPVSRLDDEDRACLVKVLGREPNAACIVWVRNERGDPVVIRNAPLTTDGRPMPTLYWLVDPCLTKKVSRLESEGAIAAVQRQVPAHLIARTHLDYARERARLLWSMWPNWTGPVPSGGVGGTRRGVKCLHAHLANWLAGANDPVGDWSAEQLGLREMSFTVMER
jgi:hypothetical protein